MSVATVRSASPVRHGLVMPDCGCGMCSPTWARQRRKSKRFTVPVTLLEALEAEGASCRADMVEQHRACLASMAGEVKTFIATAPVDDIGQPELGLPLLLFAGELASAVAADAFRAELAPELVAACEQTVTGATAAAAGCLAVLMEAFQLLSSALQ